MPGRWTPLGSWASGKPPVFNCISMIHAARIIRAINHQATQSLREKATNVKQKRGEVTTPFSNLLLFLHYEWHQWARQPLPQYLAGVQHQLWTARGISYHSQSSSFSIFPQPASSALGERVENLERSFHQMACHVFLSPTSLYDTTCFSLHSLSPSSLFFRKLTPVLQWSV